VSLRLLRPRLGELVLSAFEGPSLPVELRTLAREFGIGGLLMRRANVADLLQASELSREATTLSRETPAWVASHPADDALAALRPPLPAWPPLVTLGRADDLALTRAYAAASARHARAIGCTLTFGPVVDVLHARSPARIAATALADDAARVARHAAACVEACAAAGLATCAGHFPGVGSATDEPVGDPPGGAPLLEARPDQLEAVDWLPFRAVIDAGVSAVTVAHVYAPGLDEDAPACWSRRIVGQALRGHLGWRGAVVSDDVVRMRPAEGDGPAAHPAVQALVAGCDVLVFGDGDMDRLAGALEAIVRAAEARLLPLTALDDALRRHEAMKAATMSAHAVRRLPPPPPLTDVVGRLDDDVLAERLRAWL